MAQELEEELRTLDQRWERITKTPQTPRTLLGVIEYSLVEQKRAEVYVNRLLRYLLDPSEPHGMGDEFLRQFLSSLPESSGFDEDIYDLSKVKVEDQVAVYQEGSVGANESPGFVDLLISVPNEWFVLVELKFYAGENNLEGEGLSQTEAHVAASRLGDNSKAEFESGGYYVYMRPHDTDSSRASRPENPELSHAGEFDDLTWTQLRERVLKPVLRNNARRYPNRTAVQLREFEDDLRNLTKMDEQEPHADEKIELYLKHFDAIHDVTSAFEHRWDQFVDRWPEKLRRSLNEEGADIEDWVLHRHTKDWGSIFKEGWWRRQRDQEPIVERADGGNDLRITFVHRLQHHRTEAIGENTLFFYFRNAGANDKEFSDEFAQQFYNRRSEIEQHLPENSKLTDGKRNLIEARYDIRPDEHEDFFAAYIEALHRAFVDHAIEDEELVNVLDEVMQNSLEAYE